jgi:hypothetical protein
MPGGGDYSDDLYPYLPRILLFFTIYPVFPAGDSLFCVFPADFAIERIAGIRRGGISAGRDTLSGGMADAFSRL